jgi:hypothetical protein
MPSASIAIDLDVLRRLYVDERLSTTAIATRLGCAGPTIARRLRQLGVEIRPRGPAPRSGTIRVAWCPNIAYALGLMATDGNLSSRAGQMSLVSKDLEQVENLRMCLGLRAPISRVPGATGTLNKVQWSDRGLYNWFLSVGLTPAKSRTIGPLAVPDEFFADFFRGCVDGDGSVLVCTDRHHAVKRANYVYERLYVSLVSASRRFLEWIQQRVNSAIAVRGAIQPGGGRSQYPIWALRYAKAESI